MFHRSDGEITDFLGNFDSCSVEYRPLKNSVEVDGESQ